MLHHKTYEIGPTADWVVFVHGAGGSSAIWFKQVRDFRKKFNVLLFDLRGHGESSRMPVSQLRYTFDDVSRDIIEVLDHVGVRRAHFVGISLGSLIIRSIADIDPDRVGTVVLGGAITRLNVRSRVLVAIGNMFKHVVPYIWLYRFFAWIIMPRKRHKESRALFTREARKLCQKEFLRWFRLTSRVVPLLRSYAERELEAPTLYLMGQEDYMFLPAVQRLIETHKRSILKIIEGAGHVCNVEEPRLFNRHAIAFMLANRLGPPSGASFVAG
ncbi:MAG: alpha/beta fold hydrolase [Rhodothermales bacterium]|nr:alpha/beta fold hydrolase [Rhodothermales bacterium]